MSTVARMQPNIMSMSAGLDADSAGVDVPQARSYHTVNLGKTPFTVDVRYTNLKPIGRGAYGFVASADDLVRDQQFCVSSTCLFD